jgi:hypothetical protein
MEGSTAGCGRGGGARRRGRTVRRLCLVGGVCLASLLAGSGGEAVAAETLGSLSGQVTEATSHAPVQGIEVCAYAVNIDLFGEEESGHALGCAKTAAGGEYTITELRPEAYDVVFGDPFPSKLDFITQYYNDRLPPAEPTPVTVLAGQTTSAVDAELAPGGQIAGRVTNAATGAPIEEVLVFALESLAGGSTEVVSGALTGANGEYTVAGLATGSYKVAFFGPSYAPQFYAGVANQAEATAISVTAPELISPINAALQPASVLPGGFVSPPAATAPGAQLPGVAAAPPSKSASGRLSLAARRIAVERKGIALVKLDCVGAARCRAKLTLRLEGTVTVKGRRMRRDLAIGTSTVLSVAAGHRVTATIKLDARARRRLGANHGRLAAELRLVTPQSNQDESVVLDERGR